MSLADNTPTTDSRIGKVTQPESPKRQHSISIILPARNEADNLKALLPEVKHCAPDAEIIVVDDGSTDSTVEVALDNGAKLIRHPYSMGNGAAIKSGARAAEGDILVFMDGDGQHNPEDIHRLLQGLDNGFDMVVGARTRTSQASIGRLAANSLYNRLASWVTNHTVKDLTSGFRVVRAEKFRQFLYLLPNGFSYPTTSTMAFFRAGYSVSYQSIEARSRQGTSHIKPLKDGVRFLIIIFKIGTLYSPLKVFAPISASFLLFGLARYAWTLANFGTFTNMSALLISASALVFLMGLISEQIANLMYANTELGHTSRRNERDRILSE